MSRNSAEILILFESVIQSAQIALQQQVKGTCKLGTDFLGNDVNWVISGKAIETTF